MPTSTDTSPASSPRRSSSVRKSRLPKAPLLPAPPVANAFSWPSQSRTRFVELVALQSLLPRVPLGVDTTTATTTATTTTTDRVAKLPECETQTDRQPDWRLLPGKVEREIADNFAFLAAADVGPEFISAVCVEERRAGGILFRLAMTEGVLNEGVPRRIVDGLLDVCAELETTAVDTGRSERGSREAVWQKVLDLEYQKVVKDLRQKFKRASKPLSELFQEALAQTNRLPCDAKRPSEVSLASALTGQTTSTLMDGGSLLAKIYDQCQDVVNQNDIAQCRDEVERLLDTCYAAKRSRGFKTFVASIEIRKQLAQFIDKLGRYKIVSHTLVSLARKNPEAFKSIDIQTVSPPVRESFALPENPETGLSKVASDLVGNTTEEAGHSLRKKTGLSAQKLLTKYEELYLGRPQIHAEIQLVKFYEENPPANPPRFIGSSKKACHLCNMFLELHGKFAVSKSCQNLYPRWTVPTIVCTSSADVNKYNAVVNKMTSMLETSCTASLCQKESSAVSVAPKKAISITPLCQKEVPVVSITPNKAVSAAPAPAPTTPPIASLTAQSLSSLNASLRRPGKLRTPNRSILSTGKENVPGISGIAGPRSSTPTKPRSIPAPKSLGQPPAALSQLSMKKVQEWSLSPPQSPENMPLPPSRISIPAPARPLLAGFETPPATPEEVGGVSLSPAASPASPPTLRKTISRHLDAVSAARSHALSPLSKLSRSSKENHRAASPAVKAMVALTQGLSSGHPSATSIDEVATGVASMEVQISKGRGSPKAPPDKHSRRTSTPLRTETSMKQFTSPSSEPATPGSVKSSTARTTSTSATSTSLPPTPTPSARERRRHEKGKYRAAPSPSLAASTPPPPRPRTPLGALNLTIERHATPPSSPVKAPRNPWLDSPLPTPTPREAETEYTIYLAGNYSEGLSLGDAVFSGKLSDINRKGEMIQCRGFRLRSGLRKRKMDEPTMRRRKGDAPLRVNEVLKTSEMMVLDIIFPDAVVRMEVLWDEEAQSVLSGSGV